MKKMKKMMALVIAVVMMMAMTMTAMADEPDYKITIQEPVAGQTYSAYKLFDVTYSDPNYSYTITNTAAPDEWYDILSKAPFTTYFTFTEIGEEEIYNVTQKNPFNVKELAKELNKLVNKPVADKQSEIVNAQTIIDVTQAGYYFVDSSLGALCSLGTTNPNAEIYEKNAKPTIEKEVQEDNGLAWGKIATADIGQDVKFRLTVNVGTEYEDGYGIDIDKKFVIVDTLPEGLTVKGEDVLIDGWTENTDYSVVMKDVNGDSIEDIEITIAATKTSTFMSGYEFFITYTATVNENIRINEDNVNSVQLSYGTYDTVISDLTKANVKSYDVNVFKYCLKDNDEKGLEGANFVLSKSNDGSDPIALMDLGSGNYRVAKEGETSSITTITTLNTGKFNIKGLDSDTYYLVETDAPAGYNKLSEPVEFTIDAEGIIAKEVELEGEEEDFIKILNQAGSLLPGTGGIGTTIFYTAGALLVIAGVVVLVTRKRMENQ